MQTRPIHICNIKVTDKDKMRGDRLRVQRKEYIFILGSRTRRGNISTADMDSRVCG